MELSVIEIPEDPCPELLLWGLSRKNYRGIRDFILSHLSNLGEDATHYEQFVDTLNDSGVPPLDGEDNWTVFHVECIRSYMIRHARGLEQKARLADTIEDALAALQIEGRYDDEDALSDTETPDSDAVERWDNEAVAARVLAELLGGTEVKRDTQNGPASSGMHDYDISLANGRLIALEITQEADVASRRQADYVQKHPLEIAGLGHNWSVEVNHRSDLTPVYECLSDILMRLEELDIPYVNSFDSEHKVPFLRMLRRLGIVSAHRSEVSLGAASDVHIVPNLGSGWCSQSDEMTRIANSALCRKAEKLRKTDADERHLWIWIDFTRGIFDIPTMRDADELPSTSPDVSPGSPGAGVDVVWIAVAAGGYRAIWKFDGQEWTVVELPERARQIIEDAIQRSRPKCA